MNKQMILLATVAFGATACALAPAAQAKGGHSGHHGGHHFHFHRAWTPTFTRSYEEPVVVRRKVIRKVYVEKKTVAVAPKTIDGKGRQYDQAARFVRRQEPVLSARRRCSHGRNCSRNARGYSSCA